MVTASGPWYNYSPSLSHAKNPGDLSSDSRLSCLWVSELWFCEPYTQVLGLYIPQGFMSSISPNILIIRPWIRETIVQCCTCIVSQNIVGQIQIQYKCICGVVHAVRHSQWYDSTPLSENPTFRVVVSVPPKEINVFIFGIIRVIFGKISCSDSFWKLSTPTDFDQVLSEFVRIFYKSTL